MDKTSYKELLKTKEWKECREKILARDNYTCKNCGSTKYLNVHHKFYRSGCMPWEYEDDCLITLCKDCHLKEHMKQHYLNKNSVFWKFDNVFIKIIKTICNEFKPKKELDEIKIKIHLYENWKQDENSIKIVNSLKKVLSRNDGNPTEDEDIDNVLHTLRNTFYRIEYIDYNTKEAYFKIEPGMYWFINNYNFKYDEQGNIKEEVYHFDIK